MSGKKSRDKGQRYERHLVSKFKYLYPKVRRYPQYQNMIEKGADLANLPFHVEASHGEESIWAKWRQAVRDSQHTKLPPIVIKRRNEKDTPRDLVLMSLDSFLGILEAFHGMGVSEEDVTLSLSKGVLYE